MDDDLALAFDLADRADAVALAHFRGAPIPHETKADGSPVSRADPEVERALRERAARARPADGFLGEEVGASPGSGRRWIVDGIDGTAGFVRGSRTWGTLIALEDAGEVVLGVATAPALGRRWWAARGSGAFVAATSGGAARRLAVSSAGDVSRARGLLHPVSGRCRPALRGAALRLEATGRAAPGSWSYGAGIAEAEADFAVHLAGGPWDFAAFVPIVEEAGGRFTDLWGGRRLDTETAVFTNGALHGPVLSLVAPALPPPA